MTFPWWNQCFLNEGFARFLQFVGVEYLQPSWKIWDKGGGNSFFEFAFDSAMSQDLTASRDAIIQPIDYVNGNFKQDKSVACNNIVYGKLQK